jgi:hypothetical protein
VRLVGRALEGAVLEQFLAAVRGGESRALVLHGEPGVGKTALLEFVVQRAADFRVISVSGVQSEMELAFAGLHQMCAPLLDRLVAVPAPQAAALRITFGLDSGPVPDRLLVGLAVLSLLAEAATEQPLLCVVDDEQWLDHASAQVVAFVARRLGAESTGLVFGTRPLTAELTGLAQLTIEGLSKADACALLDSVLTIKIDQRVRDQIVEETHSNPLAPAELTRCSGAGLRRCRPRAGACCCSRRPSRQATPCSCGAPCRRDCSHLADDVVRGQPHRVDEISQRSRAVIADCQHDLACNERHSAFGSKAEVQRLAQIRLDVPELLHHRGKPAHGAH